MGMPYCDINDIKALTTEDALVQVTDECGTGVVDGAKVDGAIERASALIDSYCGKVYLVPFVAVPGVIRNIAACIALYELYARRDAMPETRTMQYKAAIRQLEDIAKGLISLGVQPAPAANQNEMPVFTDGGRVFSRETLSGM